jgi:hypothetical protein
MPKEAMGKKQEFDAANEPGDQKQTASSQDEPGQNIDNIVSDFLSELTTLSSEMDHAGNASINPEPERVEDDGTSPPHLNVQEEVFIESDPDLERIDDEIEKSLTDLEMLKARATPQKENSFPEVQVVFEQPPAKLEVEKFVESISKPAARNQEKQDLSEPQVYPHAVPSPEPARHRLAIRWALVWLPIILGVLVFILFLFGAFNIVRRSGVSQVGKSEQPENSAVTQISPEPATIEDVNVSSKARISPAFELH